MITEAEVAAYHRDGYVVPAGFRFSGKELEVLRAALDGVLSDNPDILPDRLMNPHLNGGKPYGVQGQKAFHALAHDVRILDMQRRLWGPTWFCFSHTCFASLRRVVVEFFGTRMAHFGLSRLWLQ